ncbi:PAS domain-containing protein [Pararcticibacter amylolyticus]|uniref:PAS domain-containing protein n=1 Tax=Pararcticibacter amylolyticus TaxID=2173175 RepID=A0A2U2PC16_9SPHI|nr:PAS domain-containing protein [Pararcticibacter amylolyticus]PWG78905.1 hypothetical protein DDR33_19825 [Pararcticibacter amylolyticus]
MKGKKYNSPAKSNFLTLKVSRPLKITVLYVTVSIIWILTSDPLVSVLAQKGISLQALNSGKGIFFILLTGWLLFVTIKKQYVSLQELHESDQCLKQELENKIIIIQRSLAENKRLADVIDRINNIVIITNSEGLITWVNRAFEKFTGYSFEEARGKKPDFLHGTGSGMEELNNSQPWDNKDFFSMEALHYTKQGEEYWVKINVTSVYNSQSTVESFILVHDIITEQKIREEKIKEQNNILRKIAWANSHAIRKSVASILGLTYLIKESQSPYELAELNNLLEQSATDLDSAIRIIAKDINTGENDTPPNIMA